MVILNTWHYKKYASAIGSQNLKGTTINDLERGWRKSRKNEVLLREKNSMEGVHEEKINFENFLSPRSLMVVP